MPDNGPAERSAQEAAALRALYGTNLPRGTTEQRLEWARARSREYLDYLADQLMVGEISDDAATAEAFHAFIGICKAAGLHAEGYGEPARMTWAVARTRSLERKEAIDRKLYWAAKRRVPVEQLEAVARAERARLNAGYDDNQLHQIMLDAVRAATGGGGRSRHG
jgi:hypothetical protein